MKIFLIDGTKYTISTELNCIRSYHPNLQFSNESKSALKEWCEVAMFIRVFRTGNPRRNASTCYALAQWDKNARCWDFDRLLISVDGYFDDIGSKPLASYITECIESVSDSEYHYWGFPDSFAPAVEATIPHILAYLKQKAEDYYKMLTEEYIVDTIQERNTSVFEDIYFLSYYLDMKKRVYARRAVA